jgi:micrococcal nuclease
MRRAAALPLPLILLLAIAAAAESRRPGRPPRGEATAQTRPHGKRVAVPRETVRVDDGDTFTIRWPEGPEKVRVLGIDAPELAQPFGTEARGFAEGALAAADRVELRRARMLDAYGRTLGYLFLGGRNYSVLVVRARLAEEDVSHFGDNGFPREAAEVRAAAREAGRLPFESPVAYRARQRDQSHGPYPD